MSDFDLYAGIIMAIKEDPKALIPGYETYRWIHLDKSSFNRAFNAVGYVVYPVKDAALLAIYSAMAVGLAKIVTQAANSKIVQDSINRLF